MKFLLLLVMIQVVDQSIDKLVGYSLRIQQGERIVQTATTRLAQWKCGLSRESRTIQEMSWLKGRIRINDPYDFKRDCELLLPEFLRAIPKGVLYRLCIATVGEHGTRSVFTCTPMTFSADGKGTFRFDKPE